MKPRYQAVALAAPGANTSFASFTMAAPGHGVRIVINLATASVLNLYDGTRTRGLNSSVALTAGDEFTFDLPALPMVAPTGGIDPGPTGTPVTYALRVETDSIINAVSIVEMPTGAF